MSTPPLGDTRVREALAAGGKWARFIAVVSLVGFALGALAIAGFALAWTSGSLPADLGAQFAEAFALAGWDSVPVTLIAGAALVGLALNFYVVIKLLSFGRAVGKPAGTPLADADVGRGFKALGTGLLALVAYQVASLIFSLGSLLYGLLTG